MSKVVIESNRKVVQLNITDASMMLNNSHDDNDDDDDKNAGAHRHDDTAHKNIVTIVTDNATPETNTIKTNSTAVTNNITLKNAVIIVTVDTVYENTVAVDDDKERMESLLLCEPPMEAEHYYDTIEEE